MMILTLAAVALAVAIAWTKADAYNDAACLHDGCPIEDASYTVAAPGLPVGKYCAAHAERIREARTGDGWLTLYPADWPELDDLHVPAEWVE